MLEGSLDTFPLPSVIRLLDDTGQTGRLSVHAALGQGSLVFEGGRIVDASGPGSDPVEAALALFDHSNGTFSFRQESIEDRTLDLDIAQFLELVDERETAWAEIRRSIPQDGPLFVVPLDVSDRPDGEVTISAEAWKIAVLANGRTSNQLAALAGSTEFRACSVLLELLEAGLIGFNAQTQQPRQQSRDTKSEDIEPFEDDIEESADASEAAVSDDSELDPELLLRELGESGPERPTAAKRRLTRR